MLPYFVYVHIYPTIQHASIEKRVLIEHSNGRPFCEEYRAVERSYTRKLHNIESPVFVLVVFFFRYPGSIIYSIIDLVYCNFLLLSVVLPLGAICIVKI